MAILSLVLLTIFAQDNLPHKIQQLRKEGQVAFEQGDYAKLTMVSKQLHTVMPGHVPTLYNLALSAALQNQVEPAIGYLRQIAELGVVQELPEGEPFAAVRKHPLYAGVEALWVPLRAPAGSAQTVFQIEEPDFFPEGIAYEPSTGDFFVGSVHQRKIVRRKASGEVVPFASSENHPLGSVLGLAVDPARQRLWATSSGLPQSKDLPKALLNTTALVELELSTGKWVNRHELLEKGRSFGDLVISKSGEVYLSDGLGGGLYVYRNGVIVTFVTSPWFRSPQGLAFSEDERQLYIADYSYGLLVLDMATRTVKPLPSTKPINLSGIDGLVRHGRFLIGTQNSYRPHRVVAWELDPSGSQVLQERVLLANHASFDEPTLGVVVADRYYVVANSQWARYDKENKPQPLATLKGPTILSIGLNP